MSPWKPGRCHEVLREDEAGPSAGTLGLEGLSEQTVEWGLPGLAG